MSFKFAYIRSIFLSKTVSYPLDDTCDISFHREFQYVIHGELSSTTGVGYESLGQAVENQKSINTATRVLLSLPVLYVTALLNIRPAPTIRDTSGNIEQK